MGIMAGDAVNTVKGFFRAYLEQRDLDKIIPYLTEDIHWVGTGKPEIVHHMRDALRLLKDELSAEPQPYQVTFENIAEQVITDSCAVMICEIKVARKNDETRECIMEARVTATCVEKDGGCKIASIHASVATALQEEGEYFPIEFVEETWEEFDRKVSGKAIDLLGRNIPGGMMGGYLEDGFPLYYINDQMLDYLGYTYEEFVEDIGGKVINGIHPDDRGWVSEAVAEAFAAGREYEVQYRMSRKGGGYIWVNDVGKQGVAEDGRRVCLSVVRDISAEREVQEMIMAEAAEKERQAKRYNHLFQSVLCGIVQYRFLPGGRVGFVNANAEAIRIFGYEPEEFWQKTDWDFPSLIDPRDRARILEETRELDHVGAKKAYEYRLCQKDGAPCWIIGSAEVIRNVDGEVLVQSVFLDIDSSKKAELRNQKLSEQVDAGNELLKMALEHTTTCEFYYYPRERLCLVPERTRKIYQCGDRYTDMPRTFAEDMVAGESYGEFCSGYERIHRGEKTATTEYRTRNGKDWCRATMSTIAYTEDGEPSLVVGIVENITHEKEMSFALEAARNLDRLTGIFTKETGIPMVREYMLHKDPGEVCGLMLLDMDDFGRINSEEGAVFADAILQDVVRIMVEESGKNDIRVRLGGDEFLLFVKGCDKARATVLGPRIAERVKTLLYEKSSREVSVSVSIGMCVTAVVDEYNGLYRCAESALLYVKEHGKGKAACYLDTSNEVGTDLTQIYTNEHRFNEIDSQGTYHAEDMMDFALELLGKAKNLDDAIFLLLGRIGNRYGFDRVSVVEVTPEYLSYRYTHQWAKSKADLQMGQDFYLGREAFDALPSHYNEEGISEHNVYGDAEMCSCLQAAIWNRGIYAGALGFECRQKGYPWTAEQRKLVKEITKLVSSFIMKARADAVSQAKTDFLSRMSHEIRTPMNAIAGMTTIAKSVLDDHEHAMDCLNKIESSNEYLLRLINDILDMSRIESGKIELNCESVDLEQQMQKLYTMMKPQADEKGVALTYRSGYRLGKPVLADTLRLNQVLINIIGNAVKFTPSPGEVAFSIEPQELLDDKVFLRFSVRDTGIGIGEEDLGRIFNVFEQGNRNTASKYGGTGLGLSISSRLVQMMGGTLEVRSQPGKGSEFYFTVSLPFTQLVPEHPMAEQPAQAGPDNFTGKRILLAEDNELNQEIAVAILEMQGFEVEAACDGREAVEMFTAHGAGYYDAVLMDIRMPVMDGLQATRKIRTSARPDSRTIPIIAMTANAFDEDTKKSMESGMDGHLTKPIVVEQLLELLRGCFARQNA